MDKLLFALKATINTMKISKYLLYTALSGLLVLPARAADQTASQGLEETLNQGSLRSALTPMSDVKSGVGSIIGTVLSFIGVIFLVLMIYAGILWMLSEGNEEKVKKAKGILTASIIGILIVFSAYALTAYLGTLLSN